VSKQTKHKKNILFLASWYPHRGSPVGGTFVREHAKAVSLRNDVLVLHCLKEREMKPRWRMEEEKDSLYTEGIPLYRVWYRPSRIPKTTHLLYIYSVIRAFNIIRKFFKPDIIHVHVYQAAGAAIVLSRLHNIPFVITEHSSAIPLRTLSKNEERLIRQAYKHASFVLPVSNYLRQSIESYGIRARFKVVPNTVNTENFSTKSAISQSENNNTFPVKLLFVGELTQKKGLTHLLEAISETLKKRNDFILNIIGGGPGREIYEKLASRLKLGNHVSFLGLLKNEEVAHKMKQSDVLILPSFQETFGCVLIEALSCGKPVISTEVGGIPEIINKENGVLVPPMNTGALVSAIDYMLDRHRTFDNYKISEYASELYSYKSISNELDDIYHEVLGEGN
jgi:glycosyltransferase involved in cell wall biosynthesis